MVPRCRPRFAVLTPSSEDICCPSSAARRFPAIRCRCHLSRPSAITWSHRSLLKAPPMPPVAQCPSHHPCLDLPSWSARGSHEDAWADRVGALLLTGRTVSNDSPAGLRAIRSSFLPGEPARRISWRCAPSTSGGPRGSGVWNQAHCGLRIFMVCPSLATQAPPREDNVAAILAFGRWRQAGLWPHVLVRGFSLELGAAVVPDGR